MIFVDTSVWIEFFRERPSRGISKADHARIRHQMEELLDDDRVALAIPVRIEILSGVKKELQPKMARLLSALPTHFPGKDTWRRMEEWATQGAAQGYHFGVGDLLIAAVASENEGRVWSLDPDFSLLAQLDLVETSDRHARGLIPT